MTTATLIQSLSKLALASKPTLTKSECADYVGVEERTLSNWISNRYIPHSKKKRLVYFDRKTIDEWLMDNPIPTNEELKMQAQSYSTNRIKTLSK